MTDFLQNATSLIRRGFSVIPIEANGKRPVPGFGVKSRTRDIGLVMEWSKQYPDANVGICADKKIIILETDDYARLHEAVRIRTVETLMACGSSENRPHLFFERTEKATHVGNLVVPGLFEARFENQYVVGPGSVHPCGAVYRFLNDVPIAPLPDLLLSDLVGLAQTQKQRTKQVVAGGGEIPAGTRHDTRMHTLGTAWDGKKTFDEMMALARELNARSNPPDSEAKIEAEVRYIMEAEPNRPAAKVKVSSQEITKPFGGTVQLRGEPEIYDRRQMVYGLFRRGAASLVYGSSGVGKTRVLLELEEAARNGREFLRYHGKPVETLFLLKDRPLDDLYETLESMNLPTNFLPYVEELPKKVKNTAAAQVIGDYINEYRTGKTSAPVPLVVVEGLDLLVTAKTNTDIIVDFFTDMQEVAKHYGVALVGTWGMPKRQSNPREAYMNPRDAASGCGELARMCATMMGLFFDYKFGKKGEPPEQTGMIHVNSQYRSQKVQRTRIKFREEDGRMEECPKIPVDIKYDPGMSFAEAKAWAKKIDGMSKSTYYRNEEKQ